MMIQWTACILLLSLGSVIVIGNPIAGLYYQRHGRSYSWAPFMGGFALFAGVMLLPESTWIPRLIAALIAMCLDATISVMLPMFVWKMIRGYPEYTDESCSK